MLPFGADLLNFLEKLKASYWFIPALMATGAIILSFVMPAIDRAFGIEWLGHFSWFYLNQPEGARSVLSVIAGSMITVASVTFSMTITAVSFATGQVGPRLISNFMRDRTNQLTLGTFIATFMYCLLILRTIISAAEAEENTKAIEAFVPHFSILVAMFFATSSVAVLILYIHHIPESINISNIIARVGKTLVYDLDRRFPQELDDTMDGRSNPAHPFIADNIRTDGMGIKSNTIGYIQVLDEIHLKEIAIQHDLRIRLEYRPGDFTLNNDILMHIAPAIRVNDEIIKEALSCFAFGDERTQTQDILFLADELVEIIARALSPGINDPFTAISAMDWLHSALAKLSARKIPGPYYYDDDGNIRIVIRTLTFEMFADSLLYKILPYIAADRNAAMHAMKVLGELIFNIDRESERNVLLKHAEILTQAAQESLKIKADRDAVAKRYDVILECLEDKSKRYEYYDNTGWLGGSA